MGKFFNRSRLNSRSSGFGYVIESLEQRTMLSQIAQITPYVNHFLPPTLVTTDDAVDSLFDGQWNYVFHEANGDATGVLGITGPDSQVKVSVNPAQGGIYTGTSTGNSLTAFLPYGTDPDSDTILQQTLQGTLSSDGNSIIGSISDNGNNTVISISLTRVGSSAASQIAVTLGPASTAVDDQMAPVKVAIELVSGAVDTADSATITIAIANTSTGTGVLSGTLSEPTASGVATFSDLSINKSGQYSFTFSDGVGHTTASGLFQITGGKLVFFKAPKEGSAGSPLAPAIIVKLEDAHGKVIDDNSTIVTLNPIAVVSAEPIITGNSAQLVNGVATFSNVVLTVPDTYTLHATDTNDDTEAVSGKFKVTGLHLVYLKQPTGDVNTPISLTVAVENSKHKIVTSEDGEELGLIQNLLTPGDTPTLTLQGNLVFQNGIATTNAVNTASLNVAGTYTLTADEEIPGGESGSFPIDTTASITSKPFKLAGLHLVYLKQPTGDVNTPISLTVAVENSKHKIVTSEDGQELGLIQNLLTPGNIPTLALTGNLVFQNGIATTSAINTASLNVAGTYTLTADEEIPGGESGSIPIDTTESIVSKPFKLAPLHLAFITQPNSTTANATISFEIAIENSKKKIVTTDNSDGADIVANFPDGTTQDFTGETTIRFEQGIATFANEDGVSISIPGTYTLTASAFDINGAALASVLTGLSKKFTIT